LRFTGRSRRPPLDVVNAALSYGYAIPLGETFTALRAAGLDPAIGLLHADHERRPSLALDVMEEFRPLIVDQVVVTAATRGWLRPEHGESADRGPFLAYQADNAPDHAPRDGEGEVEDDLEAAAWAGGVLLNAEGRRVVVGRTSGGCCRPPGPRYRGTAPACVVTCTGRRNASPATSWAAKTRGPGWRGGDPMTVTVVITYDVVEDRRRTRIAHTLQAYGQRIQRSVFVCTVDPTALTGLRRQLDRMLDPDTDSIYVFRQCAPCWGAAGLHRQAARQEEPIY
jgi:CRISPR-associated endonuclease Cas2